MLSHPEVVNTTTVTRNGTDVRWWNEGTTTAVATPRMSPSIHQGCCLSHAPALDPGAGVAARLARSSLTPAMRRMTAAQRNANAPSPPLIDSRSTWAPAQTRATKLNIATESSHTGNATPRVSTSRDGHTITQCHACGRPPGD